MFVNDYSAVKEVQADYSPKEKDGSTAMESCHKAVVDYEQALPRCFFKLNLLLENAMSLPSHRVTI